jgi:plasmid stabilization system protein ParE
MAAGRRSVIRAESARAALDNVVTYIAQDSREAALRALIAALDTASSLEQSADCGASFSNRVPGPCELFVFDYRLLYRVRPKEWSWSLTCTARATLSPCAIVGTRHQE